MAGFRRGRIGAPVSAPILGFAKGAAGGRGGGGQKAPANTSDLEKLEALRGAGNTGSSMGGFAAEDGAYPGGGVGAPGGAPAADTFYGDAGYGAGLVTAGRGPMVASQYVTGPDDNSKLATNLPYNGSVGAPQPTNLPYNGSPDDEQWRKYVANLRGWVAP